MLSRNIKHIAQISLAMPQVKPTKVELFKFHLVTEWLPWQQPIHAFIFSVSGRVPVHCGMERGKEKSLKRCTAVPSSLPQQ